MKHRVYTVVLQIPENKDECKLTPESCSVCAYFQTDLCFDIIEMINKRNEEEK